MRDGRPLWSATSRLTSEENAERAFQSHGAEFAAKDVDAYVDAAHAFLRDPPADVLTLTRASNGDKLYYAPGDNVFAVAREDGAPRTLFKPEEGMAYWREQETREQARAESGGERRAERSNRSRDDRG
jgi:pyocin large subunit-like protein